MLTTLAENVTGGGGFATTLAAAVLGTIGATASAAIAYGAKVRKSEQDRDFALGDERSEDLELDDAEFDDENFDFLSRHGVRRESAERVFIPAVENIDEDFYRSQQEIYKAHHDTALKTSALYSKAAYVAFVIGLMVLLVSVVLLLTGLVNYSIVTGVVTVVDFATVVLFGKQAKKEQERADRKFDQLNATLDRKHELNERLHIARQISNPGARDDALVKLMMLRLPERAPMDTPGLPAIESGESGGGDRAGGRGSTVRDDASLEAHDESGKGA